MSNSKNPTHGQASGGSAPAPTRYVGAPAPKSFDTYTDFALYVSQRKCPTCSTAFISSSSQVDALFQGWLSNKTPINSRVQCRTCTNAQPTCIACLDKESAKTVTHTVQGRKLSWCCSRGRLFVVWIVLCGFDGRYCREKARDSVTTKTTRAPSAQYGYAGYSCSPAQPDKGTGYASGFDDADDYALDMWGYDTQQVQNDSAKKHAQSIEHRIDTFYTLVFALLNKLLPSPEGASSFDVAPPAALVSVLLNSKVLCKAAELLRNDSLENTTARKDLYMALVTFLRIVGTHTSTKKAVMFGERVVWPERVNLLTLSFAGQPAHVRGQAGASLAASLRNLAIQSDVMLQGALGSKSEFADKQGQDMLWLCRMISDLASHLKIEKDRSVTTHGVVEVQDDAIWPSYAYAGEARRSAMARQGRMKRLIMEVTTLETGLAEGIWVKHGMSRLDVMKVLIVGPQGTPYENGLFEFDLFCPLAFPIVSPLMTFKGTNGGMMTVNPNLHSDGKVCLSLLGTWEGPKWLPNESTILQVLISIQAMIFCEDPIHNEPGIEPMEQDAYSREYVKALYPLTAKHAILDWATNPPALWRDEVAHHFKKNGDKILQTVEKWARGSRNPVTSGSPVDGLIHSGYGRYEARVDLAVELPKLQKALQRYGATYVPQKFEPTRAQHNAYGGGYGSGRGSPYGRGGMYGGYGGGMEYGGSAGGFGSHFGGGY